MAAWNHELYCAGIDAETARFAEVAARLSPETPVPSCPGWTVKSLLKHQGIVHRWAEHIVRTRAPGFIPNKDVDARLPGSAAEYPGWLAEGGAMLTATLREAGPDAQAWSWAKDQNAGWWARRQLHETIVHRADAQIAAGLDPAAGPDTDPGWAADGVDEFLSILPFARRPGLAELPSSGETLRLRADGPDDEWTITLAPGGIAWERGHGDGEVPAPTVAVHGPAAALLLFVYGRLPQSDPRLEVSGDGKLLAAWSEKTAL